MEVFPNVPQEHIPGLTEEDNQEDTENEIELPQLTSREALSPSSENIFVFFSCSKGNRAHIDTDKHNKQTK